MITSRLPALVVVMYAVSMGFVLAWLILMGTLLGHLKRHHASVHRNLGEPSLFWNNTLRSSALVLCFLVTRRYRAIPDARVRKLGDFALALLVFMLVAGVAFTAVFYISRGSG